MRKARGQSVSFVGLAKEPIPLNCSQLRTYRPILHNYTPGHFNMSSEESFATEAGEELASSLEAIASSFRDGVDLRDRKYLLKTYKNCFVGREAVTFLVSSGHAETREDAVALGRALESQAHLFEHVTRDHAFKDENLFFHFVDEKRRGKVAHNETTGKSFQWSDFLSSPDQEQEHSGTNNLHPNFPRPDFDAISASDVHVAKHVWPLDGFNTELLDSVHPPNWENPKSTDDGTPTYDLVVIGAGTGGLVSAAGSAGVGAKVALIEENLMGGDCLNVGCVPSKALIHSANLAHKIRGDMDHLADAGISIDGGAEAVNVDFGKVMERVRRIRAEISHHDSAQRFTKELGVELYFGRGKFTSDRTVEVNGETLKFRKAIVATGGYPSLIPIPGLKELHDLAGAENLADKATPPPAVMTNESIFNLTRQPTRLVVIGAGVIGMELAQAFQRLGTAVTMFGRSGKVLPKEDEDLAAIVRAQMEKDGVEFKLNVSQYKSIELTGQVSDNGLPEMIMEFGESSDGIEIDAEITCDAVLIAAGRRPNVSGMDLEKAGIEFDTKYGLKVNNRLQTTNSRVFGVGDCASEFKFTHAADFYARTAIRNALFFGKGKSSSLLIPYATFTSPEIASVGLFEQDLKERGIKYKIIEKHFADIDRALCDAATQGMVRFRVDAQTGAILGASIVGESAGNMISEVTLAMQQGTTLDKLAYVIHPYPTTAEAIRLAGDIYNKQRLTPAVSSLLRGVIKLQR